MKIYIRRRCREDQVKKKKGQKEEQRLTPEGTTTQYTIHMGIVE